MSRIASSSRVSKVNKRRRPSKKLAATLDSLADALPELDDDAGQPGKVKHKSLRSKKGALKKKEMVVKGEMERFGVSMARLTGTPQENAVPAGVQHDDDDDEDMDNKAKVGEAKPAAPAPTANRWAALRGYISATMEQNPAFTENN